MNPRTVRRDIARFEAKCVKALPERRRIIYVFARFEDKSADDIAIGMNLSLRTVENQYGPSKIDLSGTRNRAHIGHFGRCSVIDTCFTFGLVTAGR